MSKGQPNIYAETMHKEKAPAEKFAQEQKCFIVTEMYLTNIGADCIIML